MVTFDFSTLPIVDAVNQIIVFSAKQNASDIHFDPRPDCLLVRIRVDGDLQDYTIIPKQYERNLITRIKLLANMNITENRLPQDGSVKGRFGDLDLDMRVATLPTHLGEKVVIRILDYSRSLQGIETLGFSKDNITKLNKMINVPNGIILVTGATGTGKSTTVYSILQILNKQETNIITVEDPIEMDIKGINQVQVNSEIGLDFARVLRAILRQDPNIILIGEIRDSETAKIAVRASITGHLVLSTIHTNDSLSTIERLLDMDVERYLLSSALTGIISQKLVRVLCPKCKVLRPTTLYEKKVFKTVLDKDINEIYDVNPKHCPDCHEGYHGRIAIQEVLLINDEIRDAINRNDLSKEELRKLVYQSDVTTLLEDGLNKCLDGITSFEEIYKAIEIDDNLDEYYGAKHNNVEENKAPSTSKENTITEKENVPNNKKNNKEDIKTDEEEKKNTDTSTDIIIPKPIIKTDDKPNITANDKDEKKETKTSPEEIDNKKIDNEEIMDLLTLPPVKEDSTKTDKSAPLEEELLQIDDPNKEETDLI